MESTVCGGLSCSYSSSVLYLHCIHHSVCRLQHTRIVSCAIGIHFRRTSVFYGLSLEYCNLHEACSAGARLSNVQHVVPCFRQLPSPHSPSSSLLAAEASGGCRAGCCCAGEWIAGTATVQMACLPQPANERKLTNAPPSASCHPATSPISRPLIFLSVNVPDD